VNTLMPGGRDPYVVTIKTNPKISRRLICFAHAGGGASYFRPWAATLPDWIELCAIQLPGRETRYCEPLLTSFDAVLEPVAQSLMQLTDIPTALFGHSFGGLLAFAAAQGLSAQGRTPQLVAVSAVRAPHLPAIRSLAALPDAALLAAICDLGGVSGEALQYPQLLQLALPILRADFNCVESYRRPQAHETISASLWACGGDCDQGVDVKSLSAWSAHAGADFKMRLFSGGHFYIAEHGPTLLTEIVNALKAQESS